jgi:hypothetical protein
MKKLISLISFGFLLSSSIYGQKALDFHGKKIRDSRIYIVLNGTEIEYFTHKKTEDSKSKFKENQKFSLKDGNDCNIFMKWLNPLKYRIVWKDSISTDDRDKAIKDFVDLLTAQFGSSDTSLNKDVNANDIKKAGAKGVDERKKEKDAKKEKVDPIKIQGLDKGFNSFDLTLLFIQLNLNIKDLSTDEVKKINELVPLLVTLDDKNIRNISEELDKLFTELFNENDPIEAKSKVEKSKDKNKEYENYFNNDIVANRKSVLDKLKELKISNALLNSLVNLSINKFLFDVNSNLVKNKAIVAKLNPVIEIVDKSLLDKSVNPLTSNFYRIKDLTFDDGKKFETSISISQFKYDSDTKAFVKEKEITSKKILFEKYDFFAISVSTGLFYSSSTLKGYGVSNNGSGQFTVKEDDITKNSTAPALFLNFNFGLGSRYFAPLTQIGIDPTKKRPFLCWGGGFSIPAARIAFSGGPIWTWDASLDKLAVGQTISSTTDLEKDIQYNFDIKPKGWYFGIQYNF